MDYKVYSVACEMQHGNRLQLLAHVYLGLSPPLLHTLPLELSQLATESVVLDWQHVPIELLLLSEKQLVLDHSLVLQFMLVSSQLCNVSLGPYHSLVGSPRLKPCVVHIKDRQRVL